MDIYDVIVIGGGSAGLTAAGLAAEKGLSVLILEKNTELGKKLKITGGGRCNIYNAEFDTKKLLSFYGDAKKFLHSPFSQFATQESVDLFDRLGLPTVVQARNRAFPHTQNAKDVYGSLKNLCDNHGVEYKLGTPVTKLVRDDNFIEACPECHATTGQIRHGARPSE
jgi:predicted Rossmann fold flavoprotein